MKEPGDDVGAHLVQVLPELLGQLRLLLPGRVWRPERPGADLLQGPEPALVTAGLLIRHRARLVERLQQRASLACKLLVRFTRAAPPAVRTRGEGTGERGTVPERRSD